MTIGQKIKTVFSDRFLRRRVIFMLGIFVLFRLLAAVPVPGIDTLRLEQFLNNNQFF